MNDESSEAELEDILATTDEWYEAFAKSPEFAALSESQQRKTGAVVEFFAQYCYNYLGLSPEEWDPGGVRECCTEVLPRKVSAEPDFFDAIGPVLSAFFNFLEDRKLHPKGRALAKAAAGVSKDIAAKARDSSKWGPAKHFVMAALDAGVDIQDEKALRPFMVGCNLQPAVRFTAVNPPHPPCPPLHAS